MRRPRRVRPVVKDEIVCKISLDSVLRGTRSFPFDTLKENFSAFAEKKGVNLDGINISENSIQGSFVDSVGVEYDINLSRDADGRSSIINGSLSKVMHSRHDNVCAKSANEFAHGLIIGENQEPTNLPS